MKFEYLIAHRYLHQTGKSGFITQIVYYSILGLVLGSAALIITLAILDGFEEIIRTKIIGFESHIRIEGFNEQWLVDYSTIDARISEYTEVFATAPFIERVALLRTGSASDGVLVKGVDPERTAEISGMPNNIVAGEYRLNTDDTHPIPGLIIGIDLAEELNIKIGSSMFLLHYPGNPSHIQQPYVKRFEVAGFFETGLFEFDNTSVYISLQSAQELFAIGEMISGLEVRLKDSEKAEDITESFNEWLRYPHFARTWLDEHNVLFSWMRTQRMPVMIVFGMIILVAFFNLVSTLIIVVLEKKKDIGILCSMGATSRNIIKIFIFSGLIISIIGVAFGSFIGYVLCWVQDTYQIFSVEKDIYFVNFVPVSIVPIKLFIIVGCVLLVGFLASIYPAWRASKLLPAEAMRVE